MKLYHFFTTSLLLLTTQLTTAQTDNETRCFASYGDILPTTTLRYQARLAYSTNFNGLFQPGQAINTCVDVGTSSINLQVRNIDRTGARELRVVEYNSAFETIFTQCQSVDAWSAGGSTVASAWSFRIDPNSWHC